METVTLGQVSVVPRGEWQRNTSYNILDVVNNTNGSYLCTQSNSNIEPGGTSSTWNTYWMPLGINGTSMEFGIVSATMVISDQTTTPTVTVNTSGPSSNKNIAFQFTFPNTYNPYNSWNKLLQIPIAATAYLNWDSSYLAYLIFPIGNTSSTLNFTGGNTATVDPILPIIIRPILSGSNYQWVYAPLGSSLSTVAYSSNTATNLSINPTGSGVNVYALIK